MQKNIDNKDWDVFISHASEDKKEIVEPLAEFLTSLGAKVWYDSFTLQIGDSLSRSIDKGLANSRYGLVILSLSFLQKDWPEYELRGLVAKELGRDKVILPIWHNVTKDQIISFSPPLADKLALKTSDHSIKEIGLKVLAVIRPDLLEYIHARLAYQKAKEHGIRKNIDWRKLNFSEIRHETLPDNLVSRIRFIRSALLTIYPQTMDFWLDGFKRDLNPVDEIEFWERVCTCYLEYITINELTKDQGKAAFRFILLFIQGADEQDLQSTISILPEGTIDLIKDICISKLPVYEFEGLPSSINETGNE